MVKEVIAMLRTFMGGRSLRHGNDLYTDNLLLKQNEDDEEMLDKVRWSILNLSIERIGLDCRPKDVTLHKPWEDTRKDGENYKPGHIKRAVRLG